MSSDTPALMETQTLVEGEPELACSKCHGPLDCDSMAASKYPGARPVCKACHALQTMLVRNLSDLPPFSPAQMAEFFRKCLQIKGDENDPLSWKKVRAELSQCLTKKVMEEEREELGGVFQPISWYEKQGYCTEDIQEKAEREEHPILGTTYFVL